MNSVTISHEEVQRVLEVLRVTHRSMHELANVIPEGIHEDYDLLTASMAEEVRECVKLLDRKSA